MFRDRDGEPIAGPNFWPVAAFFIAALLVKAATVYIPEWAAEKRSAVIERLERTYGVTLERQSSN